MGYIISVCASAEDDLDGLYDTDPGQAALWDELIDLLCGNERLQEELTRQNGYNAMQPRFDTVPIGEYLRLGLNVLRLKLYDEDGGLRPFPHRLLYTMRHDGIDRGTIYILGLMPREADYDPQDAFGTRIRDQYDSLGIPRIPHG